MGGWAAKGDEAGRTRKSAHRFYLQWHIGAQRIHARGCVQYSKQRGSAQPVPGWRKTENHWRDFVGNGEQPGAFGTYHSKLKVLVFHPTVQTESAHGDLHESRRRSIQKAHPYIPRTCELHHHWLVSAVARRSSHFHSQIEYSTDKAALEWNHGGISENLRGYATHHLGTKQAILGGIATLFLCHPH